MMNIDKSQITYTIKLSLIIGILLGILVYIPFINIIILLVTLFLSAPAVMIYMIMEGKFEPENITHSLVVGSIIGFSTNITFSSLFCILTLIATKFFSYNQNLFLSAMITQAPLWLIITFIIFIGILFATTNAFSGVITFYIINLIRDIYEKKQLENNNTFKDLIDKGNTNGRI